MTPQVQSFFHAATNSFSFIVYDRDGGDAVVIDPVLDFDARSGRTSSVFAEGLLAYVRDHSLSVHWVLETHTHADHITAADHLARSLGCGIAIGAGATQVRNLFGAVFDFPIDLPRHAQRFDWLLADGDELSFGPLRAEVIATPGHTADSVTYRIGDCVFVGDLVFMPDCGTGRCDFPGGDAAVLHASIQKILALPAATRIFLGHDYPPAGREVCCESSIEQQLRNNIHLTQHGSRDSFVAFRQARDRTLALPALLIPAIQMNALGGALPPAAANGRHYLKYPINTL